jgi:hypothetical protein
MVVICPIGGLCNRFRVILSFLEQHKSIEVFWDKIWDICFEDFLSVFQPIPNVTFLPSKPPKYDYQGTNGNVINKSLYLNFIPQKYVIDKINNILKHLGPYFNTCHIRRTDHLSIQNNTKTFINDDYYIYFIKCSRYKVYIATDNIDTQRKFKSIFGDKVIINNEIKDTDTIRKSTLDNAYIDLVICSLGRLFVGSSKFSTFTTTIQTFRNINYWKNIQSKIH